MAAAGVMLVCAGCGSTPKQPSVSPPAEVDAALPSSLARARAAVVPGVRARAYLEALQALHPGGDSNLVAEIVAALRTERLATALTPSDRFRVDAVALELALADGGRAEIEALVAGLNPVEDSQRRQATRCAPAPSPMPTTREPPCCPCWPSSTAWTTAPAATCRPMSPQLGVICRGCRCRCCVEPPDPLGPPAPSSGWTWPWRPMRR